MKILARKLFAEKNSDTALGTLYYDGEADAFAGETAGGAIYFPVRDDEYEVIAKSVPPETKTFLRVDEAYGKSLLK